MTATRGDPTVTADVQTQRKLKRFEERERKLVVDDFGLADAWHLGSILVELGREADAPVAIDVRLGTQRAFHAALPGASPDNDEWIERKIRSAERFRVSTMLLALRAEVAGEEPGGLDPALFAISGGAVPLLTPAGTLLGVVTVSGLPSAEDHALVLAALERFLAERQQAEPRH